MLYIILEYTQAHKVPHKSELPNILDFENEGRMNTPDIYIYTHMENYKFFNTNRHTHINITTRTGNIVHMRLH